MRLFEMINLQVTRGLPAEPGDVSLHHTLIAHSSRSISESGVGCCGDAPYSLTVKQGSVFPFSG